MKIKKILIYILYFTLIFCLNFVNANADSMDFTLISDKTNQTLKIGDVVSVKSRIQLAENRMENLYLKSGTITVRWDPKVFEIQDLSGTGNYYNDKISGIPNIFMNNSLQAADGVSIISFEIHDGFLLQHVPYDLVEFKFKVKNNILSQNTDIYVSDNEDSLRCYPDNHQEYECAYNTGVKLNFKIDGLDNNSKLSSLNVSNATLSPKFNSNTTDYTATVDNSVSSINIDAKCAGRNCKIDGNGNKKLNVGKNSFTVTVTSEASTTTKYNIVITRKEASKSKINTLKSLSVGDEAINFNSDVKNYEVKVSEDTKTITIKSELTDSKSKYVKDYGNRVVDLQEGENEILIKVQAENGDINTYKINVIRGLTKEEKGKLVDIADLKIKNHYIDFSSDKYSYTIEIDEDEKELDFDIELENKEASYKILNNENLINGNIITIQVTSADKTKIKDYKIKVNVREKSIVDEKESQDNNSDISIIVVIVIAILVISIIAIIIYIIFKKK